MLLTFNEFLIQFNEEIEETYESAGMTKNAKIAVISTMRRHLGNRVFDPLELMELFETVCIASMKNGQVDRKGVIDRFKQTKGAFLTEQPTFRDKPDISFEEVEERRAMGR